MSRTKPLEATEDHEAEEGRTDRSDKDCDLSRVDSEFVAGKSQSVNENRHSKPDTTHTNNPEQRQPTNPARKNSDTEDDSQPGSGEDTERLTDDQAGEDTGAVRGSEDVMSTGRELDTGVTKSEKRKNEECNPRVELLLEALSRNEHSEDDPGDGRVDPGAEKTIPKSESDYYIRNEESNTGPAKQPEGDDEDTSQSEAQPTECVGVENSDHDNRPEVVDDSESGKEDLEGSRNASTEEGEDSDSESNVGRHRNTPTSRKGSTSVKESVYSSGNNHTADSTDDGQKSLARRRKLAVSELAFDLQPDNEEEKSHQTVVNEALDDVERVVSRARRGSVSEKEGQDNEGNQDGPASPRSVSKGAEARGHHSEARRGRGPGAGAAGWDLSPGAGAGGGLGPGSRGQRRVWPHRAKRIRAPTEASRE